MKSNIDDKCGQVFKDLKFKKCHRYITYKIDGEKAVVENLGERGSDWSGFLSSLPAKEPRMCVFDLEYTSNDGMNCSKLFFTYWLPDGTPIKAKMTYATFKQNFKVYLDMGGKQIVINTVDDFTVQDLIKEFDK